MAASNKSGYIELDKNYFKHIMSLLAAHWQHQNGVKSIDDNMMKNVQNLSEIALRQGRALIDERRISHEKKIDDAKEVKYEDFL